MVLLQYFFEHFVMIVTFIASNTVRFWSWLKTYGDRIIVTPSRSFVYGGLLSHLATILDLLIDVKAMNDFTINIIMFTR